MAKKKDGLLDEESGAGDALNEEARTDASEAAPESADINATRDVLAKQNKKMIMISSTEKDKDAVPVGIEGYAYNIPRDKWIEVPDAVCEILNNASITVYTQKKRAEGEEGNELIATEVRRFPFQSKVF